MRSLGPLRTKIGAKREQHENADRRSLLDNDVEQLERRRIDPVQILDEDKHGLVSGQGDQ